MKKDHIIESQYVDFTDEQLRDRLGYLWETAKRLKEQALSDNRLVKLKQDYTDLYQAMYGDEIKQLNRRLKAARKIASLRGVVWVENA